MGAVIARFKKKKNTKEILASLEDEIIYIENMTSNTSPINYYKIIFHSALLYGLISILYYFNILSYELFKNNYIMAVLAAYPIIALYYYKLDVWYYNRKIVAYKKKLIELRGEKKKILDEVMENETFKVAKEILEKYAPHQLQSMTSQNFINQRVPSKSNGSYHAPGRSKYRPPNIGQPPAIMPSAIKPRLTLPRPVLSKDRTIFDRLADIVLGDGPQNRYALICRTCGSHNGMARKEEFDYLAYRCAYCSQWNPSLKIKPQLAISYDNNEPIQNNILSLQSSSLVQQSDRSETIEDITDEVTIKSEIEHSDKKDLLIGDSVGPTIEEVEDVLPLDNPSSKIVNFEESNDESSSEAEKLS